MASTSDIRDIMNLGQAGPRQAAPKKKRHVEPQMRVTGVKREVQALMGDSVPPIAIVEQRSYKSRPSISQKLFKPRHWEEKSFQHGGRSDGLVLKHWKRSIPGSTARPTAVANAGASTDVEMADDTKASTPMHEIRFEEEFPSHKWNVMVPVPSYTDEQYDNLLKSEDWSRQETDYLMELCREYDLRWIVIADRYDHEAIPESDLTAPPAESNGSEVVKKSKYPPRSMEALKQRYYAVAARMLEVQTPASNMTQTEFQLWEKMRNFDAKTEAMRKAMVEKLFERTKDEADEERVLLEELHRITKNEDDFIKMRRELYARLEPVAPIRRTERGEEQSTAMYQTSSGLSVLLQTLLSKERKAKRPTLPGSAEAGPSSATPTDAQKWEKGRHPNQYTRRDTTDTQAEEPGPQKKGSTSQAVVRVLTPQDELRFGVSHPQERITSGVQFRHEKINRLTLAKSQTQTTKIQAALTELAIPPRLLMPTERVCREFERLVTEINVLLDCRKVNEKIATEIKILEEARRIRLGLPKEGDQNTSAGPAGDAMDVDSSQLQDDSKIESTKDESKIQPEEDQDAEGEDDVPPEKPKDNHESKGQEVEHKSTVQAKAAGNQGDVDAEDEDAAGKEQAHKPTKVEEEDEDEDEDEDDGEEDDEAKAEDDEDDEEDEDENDEEVTQSVTGVEKDEDDEDDEDNDGEGEEDEPQADAEEDEDEDEDEEAETSALPQNDSDAEEEEEEDDEEEAEAEAESNEEEEDEDGEEEEEEEDAEAEVEEDESDAEAEAEEEEDAEAEDSDAEEDAPKDEDEASEDEAPVNQNLAPANAARAHKRSASVISEASRAGSNRSGLGRKKRR